jgi:zinc protease
MSGRPFVAFLLLTALLLHPGTSLAQDAQTGGFHDPASDVRVTVLENGLTVLTLEDHTTPVVSVQIWVDVGSGDEARFTGLAHLFEHMMFRGSKNLPPEAHQRLIESRGGRMNAFTSRDVTVYFEDVTSEHLPLVIALEAERLQNLEINEESLTSEREVVIEERRFRTEDSPEGRAFENLLALSFLAHPYRIPTVGWMSDLQKMGVDETQEFFDTYYAANNLALVIAGDFDTEETLALVREHLGTLRAAEKIPRNPQEEPEQRGERRADVEFEVESPILAMAWHAPPSGDSDAEALDVASVVLSSGRTSRLYRALVYDEPVALSASGAYWELKRTGLFYAFAQVRPGASIERAEEVFLGEIARMQEEPISEAELEKAKRTLEVGLILGQGSAHALASRIGRDWLTFGRVRPLAERLEAIDAVTAEDVQRVAKQTFGKSGRTVVRILPTPEEGA